LKRVSPNQDLFEANPNETITITVEAVGVPYGATFSPLKSGGQWTILQVPTPVVPIEKRQFTMPSTSGEGFVIDYGFPPAAQTNTNAIYGVTFNGANGTSDGPKKVFTPIAGNIDSLPYTFQLASAAMPSGGGALQPAVASTTAAAQVTAAPQAKAAPPTTPRKKPKGKPTH
jgi:hypothetical protein